MAKLLGKSIEEVQKNRFELVKSFCAEFEVTLVLKGTQTQVGNKNHQYINPTGNPNMAVAGMGDALAGIIAGFIAQGINSFEAACAATYLHGTAGDYASSNLGASLLPTDVIAELPKTILEEAKKIKDDALIKC